MSSRSDSAAQGRECGCPTDGPHKFSCRYAGQGDEQPAASPSLPEPLKEACDDLVEQFEERPPHLRPSRLRLVAISLAQANEHVAAWHRHNRPVPGSKFCVGAADELGVLHAVAICGRPVARVFDDGDTIEVCRVASDGTRNANSMLYGACARAAFALGYRRVITYTQADEGGASLRAANWKVIAERPARKGWSVPSRPRDNGKYVPSNRQLWEAVA